MFSTTKDLFLSKNRIFPSTLSHPAFCDTQQPLELDWNKQLKTIPQERPKLTHSEKIFAEHSQCENCKTNVPTRDSIIRLREITEQPKLENECKIGCSCDECHCHLSGTTCYVHDK